MVPTQTPENHISNPTTTKTITLQLNQKTSKATTKIQASPKHRLSLPQKKGRHQNIRPAGPCFTSNSQSKCSKASFGWKVDGRENAACIGEMLV